MTSHIERARASLDGLSVGDALGAQFFVPANRPHHRDHTIPPGPWPWTDDTQMAAALLTHLERHGTVQQDRLAADFAEAFDLYRGYGPGAGRLLRLVRDGGDWRELSRESFGGTGSLGNGAAMRVAPLGVWFHGDPDTAAAQAALSAAITHAHPEGVAGAVAIAVAAATSPDGVLDRVLPYLPPGPLRARVDRARAITDPAEAVYELGNGAEVTALDTVPFCLWTAARHAGDFRAAFWATASAGGDVDTTCAIVGGLVAAWGARSPKEWLARREPLS
ncbi:hydrolase [Actinorhabdospora filicis]|uniref:Hydrolase n=1 Tax=Actinorhabdospora filicis TaxID=1785913 RepID=A0A9W6SMQ9_9ACTN|nr:ADP-ribosylglycohydrolase family protein [Actinorhabdospora filicis]GLZ79769.1 hydrolase [Actinorhabdospora filicis]